jgi:hypothetical protein
VETLRVATEVLHATASGWHALAGELTAAAPCAVSLRSQPSAAAVNAIHGGVAAANGALIARTQATAAKTAAAALAYTENDSGSAKLLNALIQSF